ASTASNVLIANNFVFDVGTLGSATVANNGHGINIVNGGGFAILHNSVNMGATQATGTTSALRVSSAVTTAGALDVRNNIFANTTGAGASRYAVHSDAPASVFAAINFNNYFSGGSVGFLGGDHNTIAQWRVATGQDQQSVATDPSWVSATDLHLQPASPMIGAGTAIAAVGTDIDGQPRPPTAPAIGADEFGVTVTAVVGTGQGSITPATQEVAPGE